MHHPSWCWCTLHSIEVHGTWCLLIVWRLMVSPCLHVPVAKVCVVPLVELGSGLGRDVPTLHWGQIPFHNHIALVARSHRLVSADRATKSPTVFCNERKRISLQAVVPKCLGETLAMMSWCLPPVIWVVCFLRVLRWRCKPLGMV